MTQTDRGPRRAIQEPVKGRQGEVLDAPHYGSASAEEKNQFLKTLVEAAQADSTEADCALTLMLLPLWPGRDAGSGGELFSEVLTRAVEAIRHLDLQQVNRITATTLQNMKRDLIRARRREVAVQNLHVEIDLGDLAADQVAAEPGTTASRPGPRRRCQPLPRDARGGRRLLAGRSGHRARSDRGCGPETVPKSPTPGPGNSFGSRLRGAVPKRAGRWFFNFRGSDSPPSQQPKVNDAQLYPHHARRVPPAVGALSAVEPRRDPTPGRALPSRECRLDGGRHAAARSLRVRASHLGACRKGPSIGVIEGRSDGAGPVKTRRTNAQLAQLMEAAEASERNLLLSMAANPGAG